MCYLRWFCLAALLASPSVARSFDPGDEVQAYQQGEPRQLGQAGNPDIGLPGMLTLGLVGASMALLSNPNRRSDLFQATNSVEAVSSRRSDAGGHFNYYDVPIVNRRVSNYVKRLTNFERNFKRNIGARARNVRRLAAHGVRNSVRRLGQLGRVTSRIARRGFGNVAGGARTVARAAGGAASGLAGAARRSARRFGAGLARAGKASRRRLRGLRRYGSRVGSAYGRGFKRLGAGARYATSRLGTAATAASSLAADGISGIASAAASVPRGMMAVARERRVKDCLMQTLCYVSSPFVKDGRRHRRFIRDLSGLVDDEQEGRNFHSSEAAGAGDFRVEDCEIFGCEVATVGRKTLNYVSSGVSKTTKE